MSGLRGILQESGKIVEVF